MVETFEAYRTRVLSYLGDEEPIGVQQATPSQLDRRLRDVAPEELIRRPAPEKWSIAEIVAHLADAELAMGWRLRNMLANPGVDLTWWDEAAWAERLGYAHQDASFSAGVFRGLRTSNLRLLESVPRARWTECYGVHELRGRQTVEEFVRLEAAHDLNHLQQIDRILSGFGKKVNQLGQPMGFVVPDWSERRRPPRTAMRGRFCRIESLDLERHAADLYAANGEDKEGRMWSYLAYGPFSSFEDYLAKMNELGLKEDWHIHAIIDAKSGLASGLASYMHIEPFAGSIEVGAVMYSPRLQRTSAGTEAMYLMMKRAFDELGYRRYEWRCNSLNEASTKAAKRLGFQFEGTFRQAHVIKGRNRDTAWFSIIDREWPQIRRAFEAWLAPENFDSEGAQRKSLTQIRNQFLQSVLA